jgi:PAS domain S-box-containing protein
MTIPSEPPEPSAQSSAAPAPNAEQVGELLTSPEMAKAVESDEFKRFLDHVPIAIVISWCIKDQQRIVYANLAFAALTGQSAVEVDGKPLSILDNFTHEDDASLSLGKAVASGEDFLGTFRAALADGRQVLAQAYASVIEDENGGESYRIAALVDVTDRERSQREEFEKEIRDKDMLLKELQHRVKNNLQLITALIRLEGRAAQRGDKVDLNRLAGRIDTLSLLYQALSTDHWGPTVDLGPYLSEIASASVRAHSSSGVTLDLKMGYCPVSINVAMPVGLLLNELLANTFKYAFEGRETGAISLECLREDEERYRIVYADDGVGFARGTTWPTPGKLGALILQTLRENTRELSFQLMSGPGEGARMTIEFVCRPTLQRAS